MRSTIRRRRLRLRRLAGIVATALTALALAAPIAIARPVIDPPTKASATSDLSAYDATPAQPVRVQVTADDGLDWGSIGVGAAAAGGLILFTIGGFSLAHNMRMRHAH
jgi:hypothetical protein